MMGSNQEFQSSLFYEFSVDEHVPGNHLLRSIDQFIDLSDVRDHLKLFYSHTGRPSVDPELMIRMLIIGYTHGIRSERRLCEEVHLNLAYRWFCRLDLTDAVPDHSTFSKNRHGRFRGSDLFRKVFETVVVRCIAEGVVGGERFATDASLIAADVNKQTSTRSTRKPPHVPCANTFWLLMMKPLAPPPMCPPSSRRMPTRPVSGQLRITVRLISPIQTIT